MHSKPLTIKDVRGDVLLRQPAADLNQKAMASPILLP